MRAAIYARYSSDEQTGGESIEFQLERCREFIVEQGWSLTDENVFIDRARSGTSTFRRGEFNRMIAAAKQNPPPFDGLVVWSTSRFGRNALEAAANKYELQKQGIRVQFISQNIPDGPEGELIEQVYAWMDQRLAEQIGQAAFEGQRQVTQRGYHGGGKSPFGYKRVKVEDPDGKTDKKGKVVEYTTYEVVPDEAKTVRRVFQMYGDGASYKKVAHTLNVEGVVSPGGSTWDLSAVRTILLNENYRGHRVWNQTRRNKKLQRGTKVAKPREEWIITENAHPAIVDDGLWDAVQSRRGRLRLHVEGGSSPKGTHSPYLLTGLMKCDECGANFTMSTRNRNGKKEGRYRCSYNRNRGSSVCGNSRAVGQAKIEKAVLKVVSESLLHEDTIQAILEELTALEKTESKTPEPNVADFVRQIRDVDREIRNLTTAIKAGGPIEQLVDELKVSTEHKRELERAKDRTAKVDTEIENVDLKAVMEALKDLRGLFELATPAEKRELLATFIHEIKIPRKGSALLEPNPEGLLQCCKVPYNGWVPLFGDPEGSRTPVS